MKLGAGRQTPLFRVIDRTRKLQLRNVFLLAVPAVLLWRWFAGTFHASLWWLFAVPFGLGAVSEVLFQLSWWLALRRGFRYDCERCEASWLEAGERRTYRYPAEPGAAPDRRGM